MRVLVTGADGFVGRYVCDALQAAGHQVVPVGGPSAHAGHRLDLTDGPAVAELVTLAEPEVILHLAAQSSVAQSWRDPQQTLMVNTLGSLTLWHAAVRSGARRLIYVSTAEVYQPLSPPALLNERSPREPINPYGVSKLAAETLLMQLAPAATTSLTVLRPFNHVGPGQHSGFVLQDVARQIAARHKASGKEIRIGNLSPVRDFLDIRDVAHAYVLTVNHTELQGVYNLCSGIPRSIGNVIEEMLKLSHMDPSVLAADPAKFRPADTPYLVGNPQAFANATDWHPAIGWDQTLKDILAEAIHRP